MIGILLAKAVANKLNNSQEIKKSKEKRKVKKYNHKQAMIKLFGKTRYYMALLLGEWVYYTWNTRDYSEILYQKFYTTEESAKRYAERLKKKYTKVTIEPVYDKHNQIGWMLYGKGKKIEACNPQPSNVIQFPKKAIN